MRKYEERWREPGRDRERPGETGRDPERRGKTRRDEEIRGETRNYGERPGETGRDFFFNVKDVYVVYITRERSNDGGNELASPECRMNSFQSLSERSHKL